MIKKFIALLVVFMFLFHSDGKCINEGEKIYLPILMYHQISPNKKSWNNYVISPEEFRDDMEYIKKMGWESIGVLDLIAWQKGEFEMPDQPVMITFDDGFKSIIEYAEPVLEEMGYKAVVAVIGSLCEKSTDDEYPSEWDYMNWDDTKTLSERGTVELQCHSWDMHSGNRGAGCARKWGESIDDYRLRLSSDLSCFITEFTKRDIEFCYSIAYPYGAYDEDTLAVIKDMGFQAAFTCTEKINVLTGDIEQLYSLGRFNRPHGISSEKYFLNIKKSVDIA